MNKWVQNLVLKKSFWLVFSFLMFFIPIYRSVTRELPPDRPKLFLIDNFELVDSFNRQFKWEQLRGRFVIVNFQFTRCPTICKKLMQSTQEIEKRIRGLGEKVAIISISVDPYDTPEILNKFAKELKVNPYIWSFLTGPTELIKKIAINFFKSPLQIDNNGNAAPDLLSITHSGSFYLVDEKGWLRGKYENNQNEINQMMIDLGLMVNRVKED